MFIGDNYKIESDELNITLYRRHTLQKTGEDVWRAIAYFSCLENALDALVDQEIARTGLTDFKVVVEKQRELYQLIRECVKGVTV